MTKRHVDDELTIDGTFRDSSGTLTDPTTVVFTWRIEPDGEDTTTTTTNVSTGLYRATVTPDKAGKLYGTFVGTGALVKNIPVEVPVHPKQVSYR